MFLPRVIPRHAHRLVVRLKGMLPVYTKDVSASALPGRALLQPMKPGTAVRGALALEGAVFPFEGEVVWSDSRRRRMSGRYGVRFASLPADFTRRLGEYRRRQGRRLVRWFG